MKRRIQNFLILATTILLLNGIMFTSCRKADVSETLKTGKKTSFVDIGKQAGCSADCLLGSCEIECGESPKVLECKCFAGLMPKCKCKGAETGRSGQSARIYQSEIQRQNVTDFRIFINENFAEGDEKQTLLVLLEEYQVSIDKNKIQRTWELTEALEKALYELSEQNKQKINAFLQRKGYPEAF